MSKISKIILSFWVIIFLTSSVYAADFEKIAYKNVKDNAKLAVSSNGQIWTTQVDKKRTDYFVKKVSDGSGSYSEFYSPEGKFLFSTATQYEFIDKGRLIGYSNHELKFYEFNFENELLISRELTAAEVQELFSDYKIIKISDFSTSTNSLKLKKKHRALKLILLNDTDRYFYHYGFTSNNAKYKRYPLNGFLKITRKGMIQFSHFGDNTKSNPWFILLVR